MGSQSGLSRKEQTKAEPFPSTARFGHDPRRRLRISTFREYHNEGFLLAGFAGDDDVIAVQFAKYRRCRCIFVQPLQLKSRRPSFSVNDNCRQRKHPNPKPNPKLHTQTPACPPPHCNPQARNPGTALELETRISDRLESKPYYGGLKNYLYYFGGFLL